MFILGILSTLKSGNCFLVENQKDRRFYLLYGPFRCHRGLDVLYRLLFNVWKQLFYISFAIFYSFIKKKSRTSYLGMIEAEFLWNVISSWPNFPRKREAWENWKYPIHSIYHTSSDVPIFRAERETQIQKTNLWTEWRKERVGQIERVILTYIHHHV